ncbi:hypothetical protein BH23PSE2_BH23PSE2_02350 [soil metagenome]
MKSLTALRWGAALIACAGLAGCVAPAPERAAATTADGDGVACPGARPGTATRVWIRIDYARDGRPSAVPENCHVARGTEVVFRANGAPFEIAFKQQSPAGPSAPRQLPSRAEQGMQKARVRAAGPGTEYRYGIRANGIEVDPAIIIH